MFIWRIGGEYGSVVNQEGLGILPGDYQNPLLVIAVDTLIQLNLMMTALTGGLDVPIIPL